MRTLCLSENYTYARIVLTSMRISRYPKVIHEHASKYGTELKQPTYAQCTPTSSFITQRKIKSYNFIDVMCNYYFQRWDMLRMETTYAYDSVSYPNNIYSHSCVLRVFLWACETDVSYVVHPRGLRPQWRRECACCSGRFNLKTKMT